MSTEVAHSEPTIPRYTTADLKWAFNLDLPKSHGHPYTGLTQTPQKRSPEGAETVHLIEEGGRNSALTSLAGTMRRRGMSEQALEAALLMENATRCTPPLDDGEVRAIAHSVARYSPAAPDDVDRTLNDDGNAERFAKQWGDSVRFVPEWGKWLVWQETHWEADTCGRVNELAKMTVRGIYDEGQQVSDSNVRTKICRHSNASLRAPRIKAMLELARTIPRLMVRVNRLDANPWLLAVRNGTVDLRSGKLRASRREDYITMVASVDYDRQAKCPRFDRFVNEIMGGDKALIDYLRRVFGYSLTGLTTEQCLFFFYGKGANGKSTLLSVCQKLLGKAYAKLTPVETIMNTYGQNRQSNDLARLTGARIVISNEVENGSSLAESQIKQMTGGDTVTARFLYGEYFEFQPRFKLFIAGNHKPVIRGDDDGIWRRINLIPFTFTVPERERDSELQEKLEEELPGILNWALKGCLQWQKKRLRPPQSIVEAVNEYREEMDIIGQWVNQCCDVRPNLSCRAGAAYDSYAQWAGANGIRQWSSTAFGRKLAERYGRTRTSAGNVYNGFDLKVGVSRFPSTH